MPTIQSRHPLIRFIALLISGLLLNTMPIIADAKMYKWVDANGKTHFSDRPPPKEAKQNSKEYKPKQHLFYNKGASTEQKQQREEFLQGRQKQTDRKKSEQRQTQQVKKRYAKYCKQQRKEYKAHTDKKYQRHIDDDGNYQVYTDKSRAKQLKEIKRNIQKHCK